MDIKQLHSWPKTTKQAKQIQEKFRQHIITTNQLKTVRFVAGIDIGFEQAGTVTRAAVAVLSFPELQLVEKQVVRCQTVFPYIPGYLSFREAPGALSALKKVKTPVDLLLCDGQGIAHPRRFGLACHLGILTNTPSIGVAKSRLIGSSTELDHSKGSWQPLHHNNEIIGAVLRTRTNIKPLYISLGHKIDLKNAMDYTLRCITRYRLPETTRWAHKLASG
ncbi:MAG: deoxyribonuclease V [Gammaproteobacteria bacterium]|nr:deoxyribonuclease V [Gammaproteobacteria bacterium]